MNRRFGFGALLAACALLLACGLQIWSIRVASAQAMPFSPLPPKSPEEIALDRAVQAEADRIRMGGEFYKPLQILVDYPGIMQATLVDASKCDLPASTPIIGIEVNGEYCAFVVDAMLAPETHIVNMIFNETSVSVTYCDLVDCVRVLTDDRKELIPLHVGGLDINNQLVFLFDGERYGQSSKDLPLADHDFNRMELGEWNRRHPNSKIFTGPNVAQGDS